MDKIKEKTLGMILKKVIKGERSISPEKDLFKDLGLTSLHVVKLIALIEDEFDIVIPLDEIRHIRTVSDLYQEMEKLILKRS